MPDGLSAASQARQRPQRSPRQILIDWANDQQNWVRAIASEVLSTGRALSSDALDAAYSLLLVERGLLNGPIPTVPNLELQTSRADAAERLTLTSLRHVEGVNTLAPHQEISFHPRMTVLFGENAAGKSGYVRILKRLAAVRSAEPILPNVRSCATQAPRASVHYRVGSEDRILDWRNEAGVPPFTRMGVFDSRAMVFHVDPDLDYVYTPRDLALFPFVRDAIQGVRDRLSRDIESRRPKLRSILAHFDPASDLYAKLETLGQTTDIEEIKTLAVVSAEESARMASLEATVAALTPGGIDTQSAAVRQDRELLRRILRATQAYLNFDCTRYQEQVQHLNAARQAYARVSQAAFAEGDIPGVFGDAWQHFISAGDAYLKSLGHEEYPVSGERCAYCRQELSEAAVQLVRKYFDYCNNAYKRRIDELLRTIRSLYSPITELDLSALAAAVDTRLNSTPVDSQAQTLVKGRAFISQLASAQAQLAKLELPDHTELTTLAVALQSACQEEIRESDRQLEELAKRGREREEAHQRASKELLDLKARVTLGGLLQDVRNFVEEAQWCSKAETMVGRFQGLQRSLTEAAKEASEDFLNQDFSRHFERECKALRAPHVRLEFPGRAGQSKRKKVITPSHKLSDILSEGEQKVIALADFLAEAAIRTNSAPLVFDDPVNSLDYKRLDYIVNRLVALSSEHQVIVFTHNIWFAMALLAKFEKAPAECAYYDVTKGEGDVVGIVTGGKHPRYDTPKNFRAQIKELIERASSVVGEEQAELIERAYSRLRSWCEVVVEQELLCGVALRYRPNIMMTKLPQIKTDRLAEAIEVVVAIFEKCCRITDAHSQPLETLNVRPSLDELRADWEEAERARDRYLAN